MILFSLELLFHWTHDEVFKEVLSIFLPTAGSIVAAIIAWYGSRRTAKVTREALENSKEATPPELLRLATWSTIMKDSQDYQPSMDAYHSDRMLVTYHDVLIRATLESNVLDLGVIDSEVRKELMSLRPRSVGSEYPKVKWNIQSNKILYKFIAVLILLILFITGLIFIINSDNVYYVIATAIIILIIILVIWNIIKNFHDSNELKMIKNIIFRNGCYALRNIYNVPGYELRENFTSEYAERKDFENTEVYNKWESETQKKYPERESWNSWNYGLSISWDNKPDKDKADGSESEEPTDLTSSESIPEDTERQEP